GPGWPSRSRASETRPHECDDRRFPCRLWHACPLPGLENRIEEIPRRRDQLRRFRFEALEFGRVLQERHYAVADQMRGRLAATEQQQDTHGNQFIVVQVAVVLVCRDQRAQEVLTRPCPPSRYQLLE